ncbi:MAG: circularly permuted type 2 ATP-grasp protein [Pseudomonadota bacterium]
MQTQQQTTGSDARQTRLMDGYGAGAASFDAALDAGGNVRPEWLGMLRWLDDSGIAGYHAAATDLQNLRTESGVAFGGQAQAGVEDDDVLPVVIGPDDWSALETGIIQRAALADAAITDVYTNRRAISAGLMPPGLIYGGQAFAAHCAGWERPPRNWMHIYEADVTRRADGTWVLLADRLDTPLGDGWLLANRIATSQSLADPFIDLGVRRLASHYAKFQEHLDQMMGWDGRLALMTAGEKDPRHFSHAYFARYMNATLVEPADVTVRDGSAFVKTLSGLKRVDVLLRGVPDGAVDSLHRPGNAAFGAPALSLAARTGSLKVINAIGSAALANRALAPYAHRLAQFYLGEDLSLHDAPCLWLGGIKAREQVLAETGQWRIVPLTGGSRDAPVNLGEQADPDALAKLLARSGERFCAVQTPGLSTTPFWRTGRLRPETWMMRVFACRTPEGWSVAPGGVATALGREDHPPALAFGKDVWVLPDPERPRAAQVSGMLTTQFSHGHLRRTGLDLLSRVADELFWLGRNVERAESVLRVLGECIKRYLGGNRADADPEVLSTLTAIFVEPDESLAGMARYRDSILRLTRGDGAFCIPAILSVLRSGAVRARASISVESWRYIERLCSDPRWEPGNAPRQSAALSRLIEDSVQALAAFAGSAQENLTRNYAWRFLELGRRIERGAQIARMCEHLATGALASDDTYLRAWLTISDSMSAFRSRYMMTAQPAAVVDLLILDETNPRALAYQVMRLEDALSAMPAEGPYRRAEHRKTLALLTELRLRDAAALVACEKGERRELATLAKRCEEDLAQVSDLISRAFFAHADAPEALVAQARRDPGEDR